MQKVTALAATAFVALVLVATAAAVTRSLPTFKSDLIVPNRSIGGVTLKSSAAAAARALGAAGRSCSPRRGCSYERNGADFSIQFAQLTAHSKPIVAEVTVTAADKLVRGREVPQFDTPLASLTTSSHIGLGSTARAFKRAYPQAKGSPDAGYTLLGAAQRSTSFTFTGGRLTSIDMRGVHVG